MVLGSLQLFIGGGGGGGLEISWPARIRESVGLGETQEHVYLQIQQK